MTTKEQNTFHNIRGQKIVGILHPPASQPAAVVILCHGMESSKESEKIVVLSRQLSEKGIFALRFDFAGSGESEGRLREPNLQR
jgi:predicted alpha/beta-hydrolase family hydrolase